MARSRKATKAAAAPTEDTVTEQAGDTSFNPQEFDPALKQPAGEIVQSVADSTRIEPEQPSNGFAAKQATGYIANPSSKRRESFAASVRKLPSTLIVKAGDLKVLLIDKGDNRAGIGIRVELPEGRTLTDEEKAIIRKHVKGEDGENTGYTWDRDNGMWHKAIVRENEFEDQVPPSRPVAIRLDAERRIEALSEALRQHSADPVGYADMVRQQREQAAEAGRIPD